MLKLNISPEEAFRRIFAAAKPPDPALRKQAKNRLSVHPNDKRPPALEDMI